MRRNSGDSNSSSSRSSIDFNELIGPFTIDYSVFLLLASCTWLKCVVSFTIKCTELRGVLSKYCHFHRHFYWFICKNWRNVLAIRVTHLHLIDASAMIITSSIIKCNEYQWCFFECSVPLTYENHPVWRSMCNGILWWHLFKQMEKNN